MLDVDSEAALAALERSWLRDFDEPIAAIAPSPEGSSVAIAFVEGRVAVYDAKSGQERWGRQGHEHGALALSWNGIGTLLASSGQDGHARVWQAATGEPLAALPGGSPWVAGVAFEPLGDRIATCAGKRMRLWSPDGKLAVEWPERTSTILDIAWRPPRSGVPLVAATSYGAVGFYDPRFTEKTVRELEWRGSSLRLAWSPNGKYLATGDQDASVHFWIVRSGRDLQMNGYPRKVRELSWHHSSRYLVTGGAHYPCIWDCSGRGPAGTTPLQLEYHAASLSAVAFSHRGDLLASGALDGSVALWAPHLPERPVAVAALRDEIVALAWLPGDDRFVVATLGGELACFAARAHATEPIELTGTIA